MYGSNMHPRREEKGAKKRTEASSVYFKLKQAKSNKGGCIMPIVKLEMVGKVAPEKKKDLMEFISIYRYKKPGKRGIIQILL